MDISIRKNGRYNDIEVKHDNGQICLGLHDRNESLEFAKDLIYSAIELLPSEHEYDLAESILKTILENIVGNKK